MDDQFACLPGSYGDTTNLTSADECKTCPLGFVCGWATTSPSGMMSIDMSGFFCCVILLKK